MKDSLRRSSNRMVAASPVFIIGHPRSGTSMLYRALQKHPSFAPKEIDLHETQIFSRLATGFRFGPDRPRQLLGYMLGDHAQYAAFLEETRHLRLACVPLSPLSLALRGDLPVWLWRRCGMHLIVRSYLAHAWDARGCARMVEKSPRNVPHIEKLRVVSPNCRMLFIHRHPVDVLASYRARVRRDPAASWADVSVSRFVRVYRQGVLGAYERATCEPDLRIVSYEQFTHDPVEEFRSICDFLGEPSDTRAVTEPPARSEPRPDRLLEGAVLVNRRRWEEDVDPGTARRLERDLADVMDRAGYQPYT